MACIAQGRGTLGGRKVPIQIRAQALRKAAAGRADDMCAPASEAAPPEKAGWRQADVKRAIAAAKEAGLESYRIEVTPDGTIAIIVGAPEETAPPAPYQDLLEP